MTPTEPGPRQDEEAPVRDEHDRDGVSRHRRDGDAIGDVLTTVAHTIDNGQEKAWRLQLHAPRWSVGHGPQQSKWFAIGLYVLAVTLALAGVILAVHFLDRFVPGSTRGSGTSTGQPPLVVQIGSWSVVLLIFAGAVAAGLLGFRAPKLELKLSAQPSAQAEAERARELQNAAISAVISPLAQPGQPPADLAAVTERLQSLVGSQQDRPSSGAQPSSPNTTNGSLGGTQKTVVDPASTISPKVVAGAGTAATSVAFWIVAATTFWHKVEPSVLTALSTGVTAVAGSVAAWLKTDPLRTKQTVESHPT